MEKKILHPKEVEVATGIICCGNKTGTAFLIASNSSFPLALTSDHNLKEFAENIEITISIKINAVFTDFKASIVKRIPDKDIALLKLNETINDIQGLPILVSDIAQNESWNTFGYPSQKVQAGGAFHGTVARINEGTKWDVDLECNQFSTINNFEGLSGSPLIIRDQVVGVIGYQLAGTIAASSIISIQDILDENRIVYEIQNLNSDIPTSIREESSDTTPNIDVIENINNVINSGLVNTYFLISGSPGSGKTTIAAQLELQENNIIIDRYFVKVPDKENIPTQIRATPSFFLEWMEAVYSRILFESVPAKSDKSLNEKLQQIHHGLMQLGEYYRHLNKIGFIIIDGIDDVSQDKIVDFFSMLPPQLPTHLKIIFSCTSKTILPTSIQSLIHQENEIKVTPLPIQKAQLFLQEQLKDKNLTTTQLNDLAIKSEGHPLYLRYLIQYILEQEDISKLSEWITTIPSIGGKIEIYYKNIWNKFNGNDDEIWVASTLARLRQSISKTILYEILPSESKFAFTSAFPKIQHLLKEEDAISIYHTSFSEFINTQTTILNPKIHDNIANFCLTHRNEYFSIAQRIYHLVNGTNDKQKNALIECNQEWIDSCALYSVHPDIVLSDIKKVIGLAAEFGISHEVIRLLLLSQRVNFRYNTLFRENVFYLVNALLALNKPNEAIRYIIRNNSLVVGDQDALYFLQKFYEYEAIEEAEELLSVIKRITSEIIEKGLDTESFNRFIPLKFNSVTLSANSDRETSFDEFNHIKKITSDILDKSGNDQKVIHQFKDGVGSYNLGYYIWRFNIPPPTKIAIKNGAKFDDKTSGLIALCILEAYQFERNSNYIKTNNIIDKWIEDLEYLVDNYGTHSDYYRVIISVLLDKSKRVNIVEDLIKKEYLNSPILKLRSKNGVDTNQKSIREYTLYAETKGYCDIVNKFPQLIELDYSTWENGTKVLIEYIWFLSGKANRLKAENKLSEIDKLKPVFDTCLRILVPSLAVRRNWDRSYGLPEEIFPLIYVKAINFLIDFFPNDITKFIEKISNKNNYQLGLYTEGYIEVLFVISKNLSRHNEHKVTTFKIIKIVEQHVINTVQNRWERNEYLLRIVEIYANIGNLDKAESVYKEMINTSMGPSWYKEAQLGIINTAISNILPKDGNLKYLQKFAAHLHYASGEMTFQRYVKQQQEEFVGDLAKVGFLKKSINYFKFLLLPDYTTIINNAESDLIDMPVKGQGYLLGARSIEEQAGILGMLTSIDCNTSAIVWGLAELSIPGDDRYLRGFAKIQASILNNVERDKPDDIDLFIKRLSRFIITEMDDEFRNEYLNDLSDELTDSNFKILCTYLEKTGIKPSKTEKTIDSNSQNYTETPLDRLINYRERAQTEISLENKSGARRIIVEGLKQVQKERYSIWDSNFSSRINDLVNELQYSYNSSEELIKDIKDLIIDEPYYEEWVIANRLLKILNNNNDEAEKQLILSAVLEHINIMLKTPDSFIEQYSWIANNSDTNDEQDVLLLDLLIWFLNHPSLTLKNRVIEILVWLGTNNPNKVISALTKEILSPGYNISKELSASIIHQIADLNPIVFWQYFSILLKTEEANLLAVNHFMIRNSVIETLEFVLKNGIAEAEPFLKKYNETFKIDEKFHGEVILDDDYLNPIKNYINSFNELGILTKSFCDDLIKNITNNSPLTIPDSIKADRYIERSFNNFNKIELISDFENILRFSLNVSITPCASVNNRNRIASLLRFYQPTFPENKLSAHLVDNKKMDECIKNIINSEEEVSLDALYVDNELLLNYRSQIFLTREAEYEEFELIAYLVSKENFNEKYDLQSFAEFLPNDYPSNSYIDEDDENIPLINVSTYSPTLTGGELVPSFTLPNISNYFTDLNPIDIKHSYWRNGRIWDQKKHSIPLKNGYSLKIPLSFVNSIKDNYKIIWRVNYNYNSKFIDVLEKRIII